MSAPEIVVFDWGGVLLRIARSWGEGCAAAGLPVRGGTDTPELRARRRAASDRYQCGLIDCEGFFAEIAAATDGLYTPAEVGRIHDAWLIGEYAGAADLVDDLHRVPGLATGLLSNTNHRHWLRQRPGDLPHFPTAGRVHHPHASHLLGHAKPGADIYRAFEEATGFRGPAVLFFDDLEENIEAARALGWRCERIDHAGDPPAQMRAVLRAQGIAV